MARWPSEIYQDALWRDKPILDNHGRLVEYGERVLTKEEFLMCYEAWVLKAKEEGEKNAE